MGIAAKSSGLDELDRPFLLLTGGSIGRLSQSEMVAALRRMGLRPEPVADGDPVPTALASAEGLWWLHLAGSRVLAGRCAPAMVAAVCHNPATSVLPPAALSRVADAQGALVLCPDLPDTGDAGDPSATDGAGGVLLFQAAVLRDAFQLAVLVMDLFAADHVYWSPARLWSMGSMFREAVQEMLVSAMPPVLHLVAFLPDPQGRWTSRGLGLFAGQELRAHPPPAMSTAATVRRLARLALDLILHGSVTAARAVPGLAPGEQLLLTPDRGADGANWLVVDWRDVG